jgi:hypothetical protein
VAFAIEDGERFGGHAGKRTIANCGRRSIPRNFGRLSGADLFTVADRKLRRAKERSIASTPTMKRVLALYLSCAAFAGAAPTLMIRNDRVIADQETIAPADTESAGEGHPSITVFLNDAVVLRAPDAGMPVTFAVKRGEVIFRGPHDGRITATGGTEVRLVRIELCGAESKVVWGRDGLAPNYQLLVENGYVRAYNIQVPAGTSEPLHTHHDRVVVCLSGAQLRHVLPDGRVENSSLKTGDCLWRPGQTHVGRNIGPTDLWVIAVEPK